MSAPARPAFRLILVSLPLAVIVAGIELGLPLAVPIPALTYHFWGNRPVTLLPGVEHRARSARYDVRFTTNALGFNDRAHAREREPGVARVLLLGDSYVEAIQVAPERHFARRLEALAAADGRRVDAIAMAASNQGTSHQLANYEALGRAFAPDVVVAFYCVNDPWNNLYLDPAHGGRALYEIRADGTLAPTLGGAEIAPSESELRKHAGKLEGGGFRALRWLVRRAWDLTTTDSHTRMAARAAALYDVPAEDGAAGREDDQVLFEKLVANLHDAVVVRDGRRLVGVIVSGQVDERKGKAFEGLVGWASTAFAAHGIPVLDLDARFRARAAAEGRLPSWKGDPHWNEVGHAWVAEALWAELAPALPAGVH
jgi:hypothetical protein